MNNITAHMIVKNEDRFVWYAISSVLPYVDKCIIFDTGSTDKTVEIIKLFKSKKIVFQKRKINSAKELTHLRQEQIDMTKTSWLWLVDGDEVYPAKTAERIIEVLNSKPNQLGIIVQRYDLLGDVYHCQRQTVGSYNQFGKIGHFVLRLINKAKISRLQVKGDYPMEYFARENGQSVKKAGKDFFEFVYERIFHAIYLKRSTNKKNFFNTLNRKREKIELGIKIPATDLPEVFFTKRPKIVPEVTKKRGLSYLILANIFTPIKMIKREIIKYK